MAFLTPIGRAEVPDPGSLLWFPAVGAAIGAVLGLAWWGLSKVWPPGVVAAMVIAADLALTGMIHIDGLIDTADGLLPPHADRERRLQVMKDPAAGSFGVAAVVAVLLLRWSALAVIVPSVPLLIGIWAASRSMMAVVPLSVPYARPEGGLVSAFIDRDSTSSPGSGGRWTSPARVRAVVLVFGGLVALAGCLGWRPLGGAVALAAGLVAAAGVVWLARRRLGGFTGDVLGAAGVVGETVALVVAAARW